MSVVAAEYKNKYSSGFKVENIFTHSQKEIWGKNFWQGPDKKPTEFVLDLGCSQNINTAELVNIHNAGHKDSSTKEFKVFVSQNPAGPWAEVIHETLEDSRKQKDPLPVLFFSFPEVKARYIKFNLVDWYGRRGGLQYFALKKYDTFA